MSSRLQTSRFIAVALITMATGLVNLQAMHPAAAQERVERKSILQLLFGNSQPAPRPEVTNPKRSSGSARGSRVKKPVRSITKAATPPPQIKIEKLETARRILVLGDFIANGTADGLREAFAEAPGVTVVDQTNGSSGLVRDDYFNWPEQAPAIISEVNPSIIVVQIGSNDRQQLRVNGERQAVRSADWLTEYERRTRQFISVLRAAKAPLLWVGLPAFKSPSMSTDMVALNGIHRKLVENAGGEFIDIWDGFVDEEGKFVFTGSDINGQQVRLRGSDGINLTAAGKRKIAFYAEKAARRLLGDAASEGFANFDAESLPEIFMPPAPGESVSAVVRTLPIAMTDPDLDGGSALLGEMPATAGLVRSPRDLLVIDGVRPEPPKGRADNFAWPRTGR